MINFWKSKLEIKLTMKDFAGTEYEESYNDALARNLKRNLNVFDVHVRTNSVEITTMFRNIYYKIEGGLNKDRYESIRESVKDGIFVLNLTKLK